MFPLSAKRRAEEAAEAEDEDEKSVATGGSLMAWGDPYYMQFLPGLD